jgi:NAD(P)-dependent dehydrogenase (short-subunit alcohol dehydrogenase family)
LLLAKAGARVAVVDRDRALADRTVAMIAEAGGEALSVSADVTRESDCKGIVESVITRYGRLDVLDNNVGIGSRGSVIEETLDNWQRVMRVNVESMFLMSKYSVPAMTSGGAVVNVSSISAILPRGLTAYTTSKGAVISLTKAMAVDHGERNIRVNCVLPGPVYTPMVYGRGMSEQARETRRKAALLPVEGSGWDVGQAVLFLSSPMARYITGQALIVDGGVTLKGPPRDTV